MDFEEKDISQLTEEDIEKLRNRYFELLETRNKNIKDQFELNRQVQDLRERIRYLEQELHQKISDVR